MITHWNLPLFFCRGSRHAAAAADHQLPLCISYLFYSWPYIWWGYILYWNVLTSLEIPKYVKTGSYMAKTNHCRVGIQVHWMNNSSKNMTTIHLKFKYNAIFKVQAQLMPLGMYKFTLLFMTFKRVPSWCMALCTIKYFRYIYFFYICYLDFQVITFSSDVCSSYFLFYSHQRIIVYNAVCRRRMKPTPSMNVCLV